MEANVIQIALTILAVAAIGGLKFYERKYGQNPEAWDMQKFGLFIGVAVVVMAFEYAYGNAIVFPAEDIIVPATALFGMVYTLLTAGKLVNNTVVPKVAAVAGITVVSAWKPGFTVTPTFSKGESPYTQHFHLQAGYPTAEHPGVIAFEIDWMDGSPLENLIATQGYAEVSHEFIYVQGDSKYTGHSFYPAFTTITNEGVREEFNVDGKCCSVEVQA